MSKKLEICNYCIKATNMCYKIKLNKNTFEKKFRKTLEKEYFHKF